MAIFTGGKSTAINSPRYLTLRHARRAVKIKKRELGILSDAEDDDEGTLLPGQEKLSSFWVPGLRAGPEHHIRVQQDIDSSRESDQPIRVEAEQSFSVDAPRFSLPDGSVHSVYPPPGYADDHRILPHVVLTDPHLPWERAMQGNVSKQEMAKERNQIPWLALVTFNQDELRLSPEDLAKMFENTSPELKKPVKQSPTLAVNMTVGDFRKTRNITTPIKEDSQQPEVQKERGDFIFVPADLFTSLFSPFDEKNERQMVAHPDPTPYQYLSHVRKVNTSGMAVAGVEMVGIFSIVVGNRSGPLDNTTDASVSVHLVSIEAIQNLTFPIQTPYVALTSLHSWNYTVQPPGMVNVHEAFTKLGQTLNVLRPPDETINKFKNQPGISNRFGKRLEDGYSMVKYRTQTGEDTVALYRGPLVPTTANPWRSEKESAASRICSNSGVDLQILDKQLGIMDITYSSAWQLGRTLALGDQVFTAALNRLRPTIHSNTRKEVKATIVKEASAHAYRSRTDVLEGLPDMVKHLQEIHLNNLREDTTAAFTTGGAFKRWHRPRLHEHDIPSLGFDSPVVQERYLDHSIETAKSLGKSTDNELYDETNLPQSTDWMVVLSWILDRIFLSGIPAHYFIPDPSFLEEESLRFFHIDPSWTDALVDGALSLGNHLGRDDDRVAIKHALNQYIEVKPKLQNHAAQIPAYGFLLRSDLVSMYPDLTVTTALGNHALHSERAPLLRHEIIADGVMLAFTDYPPASGKWDRLIFTQPPHQQRFAAASVFDSDRAHVNILRQYTVDRKQDEEHSHILHGMDVSPQDKNNVFIWGSKPGQIDLHMLRLPRYAEQQLAVLQEKMDKKYFEDNAATSALFAMQLNDSTYRLTIHLTESHAQAALSDLSDDKGPMPRTLKRLTPPVVNKYRLPNEKREQSSTKPTTQLWDGVSSFQRDPSYKPASHVFCSLAPHVRAFPVEIAQSPSRSPSAAAPAHSPRFACNIQSLGLDYILLDKDALPQDLVFSIIADGNEHSTYRLQEFLVKVPLGDEKDRRLMKSYDGPGTTMLSNLRFNSLVSIEKEGIGEKSQSFLKLRLVPRSSKGWIDVYRIKEMSFLLSLAPVNHVEDSKDTRIETLAYYWDDVHNPYENWFSVHFKRPTS